MVTIRKAKREDMIALDELLFLFEKEHSEKYYPLIVPEVMAKEESVRVWNKFDSMIVLLAEDKGKIVGFAYGEVKNAKKHGYKSNIGVIGNLYVKPEYRGRGIGEKLMKKLMSILSKSKVSEIRVEVFADNTPAKNLYEKLGFKVMRQTMTKKVKKVV